jgi:hypothetical protein
MAQVYSVNAVGFVNVDLPPGLWIIANPLKAASDKVSDLFKGMADGFTIYTYDPAKGYTINSVSFGEFDDPNMVLDPGQGFWVSNPTQNPIRVTFVGEVMQGNLVNPLPKGLSIKGSQVPQEGDAAKVLGLPVDDGDTVYRYKRSNTGGNPTGYSIHTWSFGDWDTPPIIQVAEGFWVSKQAAKDWTRTFSVNQ